MAREQDQHSERVQGLRNLRQGYDPVAAVGFWNKLHGEDLIDVYADLVEQLEATREEVEQLDKHLRGVESENQELREQLEGAVRETKAYCSRCLSYVPLGWSHTCNGEVARTWEKADPTNYTERTLT